MHSGDNRLLARTNLLSRKARSPVGHGNRGHIPNPPRFSHSATQRPDIRLTADSPGSNGRRFSQSGSTSSVNSSCNGGERAFMERIGTKTGISSRFDLPCSPLTNTRALRLVVLAEVRVVWQTQFDIPVRGIHRSAYRPCGPRALPCSTE